MFSVFVCQIWSLQLVETHRSLCIPHFLGFSSSHEMRLENSVCQAPSPKEWQESAVLRGNFGRTSRCSLVPLNNQTDHRSRPACHQESTGILPIFSYMFFMCWEDRIITYIYICMYIILMSLWVWLVWKWIPLTSSCCCKHFVIPFWIQPPFISVHFLNTRPQALNLLLATND